MLTTRSLPASPYLHAQRTPMFKRPILSTILAIAIAVSGCGRTPANGNGTDDGPGVTHRDSAGIEIVENHAPVHPAGQFWTIDPEPAIVLGGAENAVGEANDSSHLIWSVAGIARLEDGRVAVLSSQGKQLLLFEPSGRLSRTIGRAGEGPGEFTRPEHLQYLPPDTLVVWDYFMSSIIHFDTAGQLIRERSIDFATMMQSVPGVNGESMQIPLPDGSFVAAKADPEPDWEPTPGSLFKLGGADFLRIDHEYAAYPLGSLGGGLEFWIPKVPTPENVPFFPTISADISIAAGGRSPSIYVSDGIRNEIRELSLDGVLRRIIRRTPGPVPITRSARSNWEESFFQLVEVRGAPLPPNIFDGMPVRESFPPVAGLVVDTEGYLWVREWSDSESGLADQWSVFSPEGRWLGAMAEPRDPLPPYFGPYFGCHWRVSPCWIDRDFFLTVRQDELGVERVEGYRIRRVE